MRAWLCAALAVGVVAQEPGRVNLLLVTIDALRADRLTAELMPAATALAARGARFERVYSHTPQTLPAHTSLLTGLLPPTHGVRNNGFRLDDAVITLAEALSGAGYRTGAFIGGSALDARFGLAQGFHHYDDRYDLLRGASVSSAFRQGARPAAAVVEAATAWIAGQREPWFVWTHFRDPHHPYVSYDREVTAADTALGDLLARVKASGASDRTLVVVTADHGEALGDHGERTHGVFAYEQVLRVPLIIAGPGVAPRVVASPAVAHADVMPTVLALLGVGAPASDGESLTVALSGEAMPERPIYFEALDPALMRGGAPLTGVVAGTWKFIDLPLPELYDLAADPGETKNRADTEPAMVTRLRDATVRLRATSTRLDAALAQAEPEARARLRSLGYVGAASWRLGSFRVEDDPKRLLPLHLAYEDALETAATNRDAAIKALRRILEQRPDFAAAVDAAGALLMTAGKLDDAIALLNEARAGGLRHRAITERLAAALLNRKDAAAAIAVLEPMVEADPDAADARFLLARALAARGNTAAAIPHLEAALKIDPTFEAASQLLSRLTARN